MKKKFLIYALGLAAVAGIWLAWYLRQPESHEIRATRTFIQIDAPADKVWQVLTDTADYPQWNPYIVEVSGNPAQDRTLHIKEHLGGRTYRHRLTVSQFHSDQRLMVWHGSWWPAALLHWDEGFRVESIDATHSLVTVSRAYQGWLLPLYWKIFNLHDLAAIREMGSALKSKCEK